MNEREPERRASSRRTWSRAGAGLALTLALALAPGCKTGPDLSADYGQTARENYELALGEFADRDWEEAVAYADFVRIRFPFSRYAVEAELLVARAEFARDEFIVAQDAFRQFAKLHPTHKHVRNGWVAYMAALAAYKNSPSNFFLLPPYYQKDQSQLRDAMGELQYFFDHHSGSQMEPYAVKLRDDVNRRLLQHELYVARYYLKKDRPEAAIMRLERAHERYPGIGLDAEVLFQLGLTYLRLDEIELARATFTELQTEHPGHPNGKQAKLYLKYIYDEFGPADPGRARPDRKPPEPPRPILPKDEFNLNKQEKAKREARDKRMQTKQEARDRRFGEPGAASPSPSTKEPAAPDEPAGTPASRPGVEEAGEPSAPPERDPPDDDDASKGTSRQDPSKREPPKGDPPANDPPPANAWPEKQPTQPPERRDQEPESGHG
ncbi:MAG: outer membrane protein assembly factor BamD [Myxococcales bacterium]|nr:outer membrane protein assembly factor BamD [Myxococcales bacterium]MCB9752264.1 outer membrane protein assembly factor BamD [Myxococcales bacterium]